MISEDSVEKPDESRPESPAGDAALMGTAPRPVQWPGLQLHTSASGKETRPSTLTSDPSPVQPWVDSHRRVNERSAGWFCWGSPHGRNAANA